MEFMAGAKKSGFSRSQQRTREVRRLSERPLAILASVFASSGAMSRASAHFRSSGMGLRSF